MTKSKRLGDEVIKEEVLALKRLRGLERSRERRSLGAAVSDKDTLGDRRGSERV